eukprot:2247754-Pyramimonas_sp.AAC.1
MHLACRQKPNLLVARTQAHARRHGRAMMRLRDSLRFTPLLAFSHGRTRRSRTARLPPPPLRRPPTSRWAAGWPYGKETDWRGCCA